MSTTEAPAHRAQIRDLALRGRKRLAVIAIVRTGLTIALVVAIYFLLPLDHSSSVGVVAELAIGILCARGNHRLAGHEASSGRTTQRVVPSKRSR